MTGGESVRTDTRNYEQKWQNCNSEVWNWGETYSSSLLSTPMTLGLVGVYVAVPHWPFWKVVGSFWISYHFPMYCRENARSCSHRRTLSTEMHLIFTLVASKLAWTSGLGHLPSVISWALAVRTDSNVREITCAAFIFHSSVSEQPTDEEMEEWLTSVCALLWPAKGLLYGSGTVIAHSLVFTRQDAWRSGASVKVGSCSYVFRALARLSPRQRACIIPFHPYLWGRLFLKENHGTL